MKEDSAPRFRVFMSDQGYKVSIPNYYGGEVVRAEVFDALIADRDALIIERDNLRAMVVANAIEKLERTEKR